MSEVAFLGLGVMGYPMAGHLARGGHSRRRLQPDRRKSARVGRPSTAARAPRRRARRPQGRDFVFACVGNDADLRSVALGPDGAFAGMKRGAVFVDHTTASADVARELHAEAAKLGLGFIDAPVSGGEAGAKNGALTVMCGGARGRLCARRAGHRRLREIVPPAWADPARGS